MFQTCLAGEISVEASAVEGRVRETASILGCEAHRGNGGSLAPGAVSVGVARAHVSVGRLAFFAILADELLLMGHASAVEGRIRQLSGVIRAHAHGRDSGGLAPSAFVVRIAVVLAAVGSLALIGALVLNLLGVTVERWVR